MLQLYDGDYIADDLDALRANLTTADDADVIDVFLTELGNSEDALWTLKSWKSDFSNPYFNCRAVSCFQNEGYNIYRIRPLGNRTSRYRILYAYDCQHDDYYVLAITIKKPDSLPLNSDLSAYYDYERDHPISQRVRDEYDSRGLPRLSS